MMDLKRVRDLGISVYLIPLAIVTILAVRAGLRWYNGMYAT